MKQDGETVAVGASVGPGADSGAASSDTRAGIVVAVEAAKGQVKLAEALGVTQQSVSKWVRRGWAPVQRAAEIEHLTGVPRVRLVKPQLANLLVDAA